MRPMDAKAVDKTGIVDLIGADEGDIGGFAFHGEMREAMSGFRCRYGPCSNGEDAKIVESSCSETPPGARCRAAASYRS